MIKLFIGSLLPGIPCTEILFPNLGNGERTNPFGEKLFDDFTVPLVEIENNPEAADYFCIPHNYNYIKKNTDYLESFEELAKKHSKKILIFFPGDSDENVPVSNSIVFRNSQYGYKKKTHEVIMPAFVVDLGTKYGVDMRKKGDKAVVGFCGWATPGTLRGWLSYFKSNLSAVISGRPLHLQGLYYRRKTLSILRTSSQVMTNFIIRSSYSGSDKTISVDAESARKEYIQNMKNSDLILSPKGDGNFSMRFFEALSLGRIPLLIDTDCPLPLQDEISYDDFILRVSYREINNLGSLVYNFYNALSEEEYVVKQKKCREVFEKTLSIQSFFKNTMTEAFLQKIAYTIDATAHTRQTQ